MKAYLVLDLCIQDMHKFREYIACIPEFIKRHGGRYLVEGAQPISVEGGWQPERMVIIEFPTSDNARAFLQDPGAQSLFTIRHQTTVSKLVMVEGNA